MTCCSGSQVSTLKTLDILRRRRISQVEVGTQSLADLLSVSLQNLDGEAEMRRFFGSRVVTANRAEQSSNRKKGPQVKSKSHSTTTDLVGQLLGGKDCLCVPSQTREVDTKFKAHGWNPMQEKW